MCAEAFIMRLNTSGLVPHLTAYTRTSYITKDSPREVGQVTLVAKQPDCAAQSHGFENFN